MAFMRAYVSEHTHRFLVSDSINDPVMCEYNHIDLPVGTYDEDDDLPRAADWPTDVQFVPRFEIVEKYWGRMEAPGYLDCSDFVMGDTRAEVAAELLNMHFEGGFEGSFAAGNDLDEGEVVDVAFLECLVQGKIK
jgi:hypothetical protein